MVQVSGDSTQDILHWPTIQLLHTLKHLILTTNHSQDSILGTRTLHMILTKEMQFICVFNFINHLGLLSDLWQFVEHVPLNAIQETHRTVDLSNVDVSPACPHHEVCNLVLGKVLLHLLHAPLHHGDHLALLHQAAPFPDLVLGGHLHTEQGLGATLQLMIIKSKPIHFLVPATAQNT